MNNLFNLSDIDALTLDIERKRSLLLISEVVPSQCLHEVGSTAVAGVIGKQDLDFLVRVSAAQFQSIRAALDKHFARNPDQLSNEQYQGYIVESTMDVAIQLTVSDGPYDTFLPFLEELRHNSDVRQRYNQLKSEFNGSPMSEYRNAKRQFIEDVLASKDTTN